MPFVPISFPIIKYFWSSWRNSELKNSSSASLQLLRVKVQAFAGEICLGFVEEELIEGKIGNARGREKEGGILVLQYPLFK